MNLYQRKILENLSTIIEKEQESMAKATQRLIDATLNKRSIFAFGASHAGILTQELYYRAGGLMTINPIFSGDTMVNAVPITRTTRMEQLEGYGKVLFETSKLKKNDILIIHSVSGRNPLAIEMAIEAAKHDIEVIALTNLTYSKSVTSRHSSGKKLYEIAHIVIDTHGEIGDAILTLPNSSQKVGPASTINACFIMNSIVSDVAFELAQRDPDHVPVFYSANLDGTTEKNQKLVDYYNDVIHYDF